MRKYRINFSAGEGQATHFNFADSEEIFIVFKYMYIYRIFFLHTGVYLASLIGKLGNTTLSWMGLGIFGETLIIANGRADTVEYYRLS